MFVGKACYCVSAKDNRLPVSEKEVNPSATNRFLHKTRVLSVAEWSMRMMSSRKDAFQL